MSLRKPADRQSKPFTWKIENFSKLKTKNFYSDTFYSGGYKWRVLIFPKGNDVKYLSVYLDVPDSATLPYGLTRYAQFSVSVINQIRNKSTVTKDTHHQFNARESDWGFTSFLPLKELNDPVQGFLLNDTIIVKADVTVPNPNNSELETVINGNPEKKSQLPSCDNSNPEKESQLPSCDNSSGKLEADITSPQSTLQSTLGSQIAFVDGSSEATATVGKVGFLSYWVSSGAFQLLEKIHGLHKGIFVKFSMKGQALQTVLLESFASFIASMSSTKVSEVNEEALQLAAISSKVGFLSYWVSSEAFQLLEKIHSLHKGTFVKFSMKGQALQTVLLESFASFIASMSSTKVSEVNEEALRLAAISIEDYEQVGLDLRWLKQRLEEAKEVKKHSESVNTVESCGSSLEVARAKVRELEEGLAKAKAEVEAMSRDLPKSLGVNDSVLKDIV